MLVDGDCFYSPNYPEDYGNHATCTITALADGHPSQAVRGLAAQFEASLPTAKPTKKKKRKSAK